HRRQIRVTHSTRRCAPAASRCRRPLVRRGSAGDAPRRACLAGAGCRPPVSRGLGLQHPGTARVRRVERPPTAAVPRGLGGAVCRLAAVEVPGTRLALWSCRRLSEWRAAWITSLLMWFYGDRIRDDIDDVTMNMRERAAAGLEGAAERLQAVADTVEDGLSGAARRAS